MVQREADMRNDKKTIQKDLLAKGLKKSDAQDHTAWRQGWKTGPDRSL